MRHERFRVLWDLVLDRVEYQREDCTGESYMSITVVIARTSKKETHKAASYSVHVSGCAPGAA